uniref:XIAP-associated factor 1 n=1 Tax=Rhizophora mucronata TaxID=61149 RepID=A0A2P2KYE3_RHIMU
MSNEKEEKTAAKIFSQSDEFNLIMARLLCSLVAQLDPEDLGYIIRLRAITLSTIPIR